MGAKRKRIRYEIPTNISKKLMLGANIYKKHNADGASSLLSIIDWATQGPKIAIALQHHKKAEQLRRQMEQEYELRNNLLVGIDEIIRQSRDILKGKFRKEPHKSGEWGFDVTENGKPIATKKK